MIAVIGRGVGIFVVLILGMFALFLGTAGAAYFFPQFRDMVALASGVMVLTLVMMFVLLLFGARGTVVMKK